MPITITTHECTNNFNQALQAAYREPVFITDQGQPVQVLLSFQEYQRLNSNKPSIVDLIAMNTTDIIEFEPPHLTQPLYKLANLS